MTGHVTTSVLRFRICSCASLLDAQPSLFSSGLPQIGNFLFEKAACAVVQGRLALRTLVCDCVDSCMTVFAFDLRFSPSPFVLFGFCV